MPDTGHEGMAPMRDSIGKYDWEMLDLTYDSTYLTRPYDQYYQVVRFNNDTATWNCAASTTVSMPIILFIDHKKWYLVTLYELPSEGAFLLQHLISKAEG